LESEASLHFKKKTNEDILEEKKKQIQLILKENLYNSFAQAIIKCFTINHFVLKVFLTLCLLASSGLASYLVIQSIINYLSFGASTTSRTLFENPTLFPQVTFCNLNWLTTEYAYNFKRKKSLHKI
jgi:hypothetical protein